MKHESESKRKLLEAAIDMIWRSSYGSVSVDDICAQAGVNKGSFYYAFKSKSDLAVAAYERYWENKRLKMDVLFSPQVPAMERLEALCQVIIKDQLARYETYGKMPGCPFCSIGSELGTQDENIRQAADKLGSKMLRYFESLLRDLAAEGHIECTDPAELSREMCDYITGVQMQAKIENNPKHLDRLKSGLYRLLGIKKPQPAAA